MDRNQAFKYNRVGLTFGISIKFIYQKSKINRKIWDTLFRKVIMFSNSFISMNIHSSYLC